MKQRWKVNQKVEPENSSGSSSIITGLLEARGYKSFDDVEAFLNPQLSKIADPFLLKGVDAAVERIVKALVNVEKIVVYGDYDVDGITSTTLLTSFLREIGCLCDYYIPNRFDDGYGLNIDSLQSCKERGADLIISVDCGITSVNEALYCRQNGIDLIITDHHAPLEIIPECIAVINPLQPGCKYPFKALAGVGVVFNLMIVIRSVLRTQGAFVDKQEPDLRQWLDLLSIGTIADVVPLIGQNRIYVQHGLKKLSSTARQGLVALKKVSRISEPVRCGQVGFRLAPRLNAAGRMESAVPGVELLLGTDPEQCRILAEELDIANSERQHIERQILDNVFEMVDKSRYPECRSIVLASEKWHQGVIGIVASRVVEKYHRPTILIAIQEDGTGKGSGRSIPGFHLLDAISACSEHLIRFGGHRYAAGIGVEKDKIEQFQKAFEVEASRLLSEEDCIPTLSIDAEVSASMITLELVNELKKMEPFGAGNPEPLFLLKGIKVVDKRIVGEKHLKLSILSDSIRIDAIAFGMSGVDTEGLVDIAFFPEINSYNGRTTLQLRIKGLRKASQILYSKPEEL